MSRSALLMALCLGRASLSDASWALTMPVTKPCSSRKSCIISSEAGLDMQAAQWHVPIGHSSKNH